MGEEMKYFSEVVAHVTNNMADNSRRQAWRSNRLFSVARRSGARSIGVFLALAASICRAHPALGALDGDNRKWLKYRAIALMLITCRR